MGGVQAADQAQGRYRVVRAQPFTSLLRSNLAWFKYSCVGEVTPRSSDCKRKPLKKHEDICVFAPNGHTYNPVMKRGTLHSRGTRTARPSLRKVSDRQTTENADYYPTSIIPFSTIMIPEHPTQKPVALLEDPDTHVHARGCCRV